jgi:hypothetical protein
MNKTGPQTLDLVPFGGLFGRSIARGRGEPASLLLQIVRGLVVELCGPAGLPSVFRRSIFFFSSSKVPQFDHKIPMNIACAISYQLLRNLSSTMGLPPTSSLPSKWMDTAGSKATTKMKRWSTLKQT